MDYSAYTAKELAMNEHFQKWVLHPQEPELHSFWTLWQQAHPEKKEAVQEARYILEQMQFTTYTLPEAEANHMLENILSPDKTILPGTKNAFWNNSRRAAAVISLLIVSMVGWFIGQTYFSNNVYTTAYGEKRTIVLPDNSTVVLNANSSLSFSQDWVATSDRQVWLEGEGYFSVVHTDQHQKFVVHTSDGLRVEVLGTEFNVARRKNTTKVVLSSGKVRLSLPATASSQGVLMNPGDLVEYTEARYTKRIVDPQLYTGWTKDRLILNHTSLKEISQMLKDNYGLQVQVSRPELLQQTVSGSMPLGDVDKLLAQIGKTFRMNISRDGQHVTIREYPD